jgi:hypothetical protein
LRGRRANGMTRLHLGGVRCRPHTPGSVSWPC